MSKRRRFTADFKARVALDALRGDQTIQEIASRHKVHPNQVSTWKREAMDGLDAIFSNGTYKARVDSMRGRSTISMPRSASSRRIDELFLKYPFYSSRQMVRQLRREGVRVGRALTPGSSSSHLSLSNRTRTD